MTGRYRVIRTIILCALFAGFGYATKGAVDQARLAREEVGDSGPGARDGWSFGRLFKPKLSAKSFKYDSIPKDKGTLALDYSEWFDLDPISDADPDVRRLKRLICEGRCEEVFEELRGEVESVDFFARNEEPPRNCRDRVHLLAIALELKVSWEKAHRVYLLLYPSDREASRFYLSGLRANIDWAFVQLRGFLSPYLNLPVDEAIEEFVEQYNDPNANEGAREAIWTNERYRRLYFLLDQLLQITNPKYHFDEAREKTSKTRFVKPNREAREEFRTFVETGYERFMADPRKSDREREQVEKTMAFLRKLLELP